MITLHSDRYCIKVPLVRLEVTCPLLEVLEHRLSRNFPHLVPRVLSLTRGRDGTLGMRLQSRLLADVKVK